MAEKFDTINLNSIEEFTMPSEMVAYVVKIDGIRFDFVVKPKAGARGMFVFSPGFLHRSSHTPPYFQRLNWLEHIDQPVVILTDPTLTTNKNISLAWFQVSKERSGLPGLAAIVDKVANSLQINKENTVFYGSSAGGFSSLMLPTILKYGQSIVNNPQTYATRFLDREVGILLKEVFGGMTAGEAERQFPERLVVMEAMKSANFLPRVLYIQNLADEMHFEQHFKPFMGFAEGYLRNHPGANPIKTEIYNDPEAVHNPLGFGTMGRVFAQAKALWR